MAVYLHQGDLPEGLCFEKSIAVDTEAMGLNPHRDRLCLVQIGTREGDVHLVQFQGSYAAPRLKSVLEDSQLTKIFHFARFDVALLYRYLGVWTNPLYCTKVVSKLVRTYTDKHGLKDLCKELLGIEISKQQQTSDWGTSTLTEAQLQYAAQDVLHLHPLKDELDQRLMREKRRELAERCFHFLPLRSELDLLGWNTFEQDVFQH